MRLISCVLIFAASASSHAQQSNNAQQLFEQLRNQVYQVRVIDSASGDKYSIGSGFQIAESGLVATNFHVVSSYVHDPQKYRLELVRKDGETIDIELKDIDVIHDLAIVWSDQLDPDFIPLSKRVLKQGDRIFSMGNPHDLGMTIVEGTFNGQVQHVRHGQILFSGSLNAGMSGGPALDPQGRVIGINVAKGGDDISFLVAVDKLQLLMQRVESQLDAEVDFPVRIQQALLDDQDAFYQSLLAQDFETDQLGDVEVPVQLAPNLRCWGHTEDEDDVYYVGVHQHCQSEDSIYISGDLYTGRMTSDYEWITTDRLNQFQFYSAVSKRFEHNSSNNSKEEKEVGNYACLQDSVASGGQRWQVSSCFRPYQKYDELYDASLLMVSLDSTDAALVVKYSAAGISKQNAISLFKRVMESIEWKH